MTAKEKALELFNKYDLLDFHDLSDHFESAKHCAFIAVEEIINVLFDEWNIPSKKTNYWKEVRSEIVMMQEEEIVIKENHNEKNVSAYIEFSFGKIDKDNPIYKEAYTELKDNVAKEFIADFCSIK